VIYAVFYANGNTQRPRIEKVDDEETNENYSDDDAAVQFVRDLEEGKSEALRMAQDFLRSHLPGIKGMGLVHSSHGDFRISMRSGEVFEFHQDSPDETGYENILQFDLLEYFDKYDKESRSDVQEFDILDLGYWMDDGSYEPPDEAWRNRDEHGS